MMIVNRALRRRMPGVVDQLHVDNEVAAGAAVREKESAKWAHRVRATLWVSSAPTLLVLIASAILVFEATEARYIHATYRFTEPNDARDQQLASNGIHPTQLSRRQDYEGDADDYDNDDQKAAASYRNQDDNGGEGGGNGGDNYGDNESDGPYDETPVEQEGQADLERFFDDHLGASDREGMDKENLPTNLVALLSKPPQLIDFDVQAMRSPLDKSHSAGSVLTVAPLVPVANPIVNLRENFAQQAIYDELSSLPTIQTSFIRLPDEKMIITHQVTARNSDRRPPPRLLKFFTSDEAERRPIADGSFTSGERHANQGAGSSSKMAATLAGGDGDVRELPLYALTSQQRGLKISPTESLTGMPFENLSPANRDSSQVAKASNNEVVATEDDEFDRVYVTNETSRPFRIDALGGYDPEEDFKDAAKELEVMVSDGIGRRVSGSANADGPTKHGLKRRSNQWRPIGDSNGDDLGEPGADLKHNESPQQQHEQAQVSTESVPVGQEISFSDPDTDTMYEDASETDEVTFGQDDPYQTDLEAEMRQQEYDKIIDRSEQQRRDQPDASGSLNVVVDDGNTGPAGTKEDDASDEDYIDSEYKPEVTNLQRDSMAAAATRRKTGGGRPQTDIDDEGSWVNDGVDEMDIPSQSHQNLVLEKAEQRDEAAKKAADEGVAADKAANKQDLDGSSAESGQTNDNVEENVRMPNADYLKNDFIEDDSGYAA